MSSHFLKRFVQNLVSGEVIIVDGRIKPVNKQCSDGGPSFSLEPCGQHYSEQES